MSNTLLRILQTSLLTLLAPLLPAPALYAQAPTGFAVIDIQKALLGTREGRKAADALQSKVQPKRSEFERREKELEDAEKNLEDDKTLTDAKRQEMTDSLAFKRKQLEREQTEAEEDLEQEENHIVDKLSPLLVKVLEKYAYEHGYAMIFDVSDPHNPVLWASEAADLTETIVSIYDAAALQDQPPSPPTTKSPNAVKPHAPATSATKPN